MGAEVCGWPSLADNQVVSVRLLSCDISESHGLLPLLQALLNIIQHLHSCFWNTSAWTKHIGNAGFVQEVIILLEKRFKSYS